MIKLVIWDLDDTLWSGTLSESESVSILPHRADLVFSLNRHGVLSSICSKNDPAAARAKLEHLGLWDQFVFPRIAFEAKGAAIAAIISDMQLRPADVLFVDDNPLNLAEARFRSPDLQILDIRDPDADATLKAILTEQPASRDRLTEYRSLERKKHDQRAAAASHEDFLRSCEIQACEVPMMGNLDFLDRIVDLINRSNQLNYTNSRVDIDSVRHDIIDGYLDYVCRSIFAWDKYGDHGLVGFLMIHRHTRRIKHFVFSCRAMHMGLEGFALAKMREYYPDLDVPEDWKARIGSQQVDWVKDLPYHDPDVRQRLFTMHGQSVSRDAALRIMHACQSGGLAHYSKFREAIDFDHHPRLFAINEFAAGTIPVSEFPPFLVYGAGIDYKDEAWPDLAHLLDTGLYAECVHRMCRHLANGGHHMLVVLPPEHLPADLYRPEGLSRARAQRYNAVWHEAAERFSCLTVIDVERVCHPEDFVDVNHLRPCALQIVASLIDIWFGCVSGAPEGAWMEVAG